MIKLWYHGTTKSFYETCIKEQKCYKVNPETYITPSLISAMGYAKQRAEFYSMIELKQETPVILAIYDHIINDRIKYNDLGQPFIEYLLPHEFENIEFSHNSISINSVPAKIINRLKSVGYELNPNFVLL